MSRIRGKRTGPEEAVAGILRSLGVSYRRNVKSLLGCPDFVVGNRNLILFVHGCFWHRHSNCKRASMPSSNQEFWEKKFTLNIRRDRRNARKLRANGWRVITVWQCQLRDQVRVKRRLQRLLVADELSGMPEEMRNPPKQKGPVRPKLTSRTRP